ncbi:MAG TPA: hypothetical protein VGN57_08240 [Pirellulaceae bacterium]|jgi:hypothetical protein|nr:hypothetical protein [Pirellulaceae bacterium]
MPSSVSFYPSELAAAIRDNWIAAAFDPALLPDQASLEQAADVTYQASLLREETEPVRCRTMLASPEDFRPYETVGRDGLAVMRFRRPAPFAAHELRKLSAAAGYYRSTLAVNRDAEGCLQIWGMIFTGTRWLSQIHDADPHVSPLPPNLAIQVVAPGHLIVASGHRRLLETSGGELLSEAFDPFRSEWLPLRFQPERASLLENAATAPLPSGIDGTRLCDSFVKDAAQNVIRRTLNLVRSRGHGGTLIYLSADAGRDAHASELFRFRVAFENDDATLRFRHLMRKLLQRVLEIGFEQNVPEVTWGIYRAMHDGQLAELDDALVEFAHFLADLMAADGALVLDRQFRIIGFGAEILGDLHVREIHRALDLEASRTSLEPADRAGTRHRSAYRLVSTAREAIALVVSQDGGVRFVAHKDDKLTFWPYLP